MISKRIRNLRVKKELKQEDIAKMIKVSKQTYYKWEKGETEPTASKIESLAKIFGVPIETLFQDSELTVSQETKHKIMETEKLNDEEKKCLNMFLEAMLLRHYSKTVSSTLGL